MGAVSRLCAKLDRNEILIAHKLALFSVYERFSRLDPPEFDISLARCVCRVDLQDITPGYIAQNISLADLEAALVLTVLGANGSKGAVRPEQIRSDTYLTRRDAIAPSAQTITGSVRDELVFNCDSCYDTIIVEASGWGKENEGEVYRLYGRTYDRSI
jgi:hypothetical protein